jgi:hypothetical protein
MRRLRNDLVPAAIRLDEAASQDVVVKNHCLYRSLQSTAIESWYGGVKSRQSRVVEGCRAVSADELIMVPQEPQLRRQQRNFDGVGG